MAEMAKKVREVRAEATSSAATPEPAARQRAEDAIHAAKGAFVAAGLEYANRRFGIREIAFTEGYATLVFQASEWELPPLEAVR
jgi:hypothetical protein